MTVSNHKPYLLPYALYLPIIDFPAKCQHRGSMFRIHHFVSQLKSHTFLLQSECYRVIRLITIITIYTSTPSSSQQQWHPSIHLGLIWKFRQFQGTSHASNARKELQHAKDSASVDLQWSSPIMLLQIYTRIPLNPPCNSWTLKFRRGNTTSSSHLYQCISLLSSIWKHQPKKQTKKVQTQLQVVSHRSPKTPKLHKLDDFMKLYTLSNVLKISPYPVITTDFSDQWTWFLILHFHVCHCFIGSRRKFPKTFRVL